MTSAVLVNRTPHDPLVIWQGDRVAMSLPAEPSPARCAEIRNEQDPLAVGGVSIPIVSLGYGQVSDLPEPVSGVVHVVSQLVCQALPDRTDLVYPAMLRRDESGNVIGCEALSRPAGLAPLRP